jgi:hypothetical protein
MLAIGDPWQVQTEGRCSKSVAIDTKTTIGSPRRFSLARPYMSAVAIADRMAGHSQVRLQLPTAAGCRGDIGWIWTSRTSGRWVPLLPLGSPVRASPGEIVRLPASEQVIAALALIIGGLIRDGKSGLRQGAAP